MKKCFIIDGRKIEVENFKVSKTSVSFVFNQKDYSFKVKQLDSGKISLQHINEETHTINYITRVQRSVLKKQDIVLNGIEYHIESVLDLDQAEPEEELKDDKVQSPLPGKVYQVMVKSGDKVKAGQDLIIIEAMKVEHSLCAPGDGAILDVHVQEGEQVEQGQLLIDFNLGVDSDA